MSNIIPFESALPAYLKAAQVNNDDLTSHAGTGYPIIRIKGSRFTVTRDGESTLITNPKDPDAPATKISMVIVKASKGTSKVWYAKGYTEGSDAKPDCWSNDGVKPDQSVELKQSATCQTCAKNAWGSKIGDNGTSKGKACSDSVRIAVATPDQINDPYFLRVPAASIRNLGEFGKMLAKRGVQYQMVVTEISFDLDSPTPLLKFKPIGFLPEADYAAVKEQATGDVVQAILGSNFEAAVQEAAAEPAEPAVAAQAAAVVEKAKAAPAPVKPAAKPAPKVVTEEEVVKAVEAAAAVPATEDASIEDLDLDDIDFS